jgi:NTE family protein
MPWRREQPDVNGEIRIPSLTEAERRALALGCLPPTGRGSRLLGWCARDLAHLKVGLALGAGSSKGYAHFGVAGVLASAGVPIDYIAGTSIGSLVATMIATGRSLEESARLLDGGGAAVFRLGLPRSSLLSGAGLTRYLQDTAGDDRIEDSVIPLAVIAADLKTRREIVLRRGLLRVALRASTSIPGILPPLPMGPYLLVDGGILNPIPSSAVVRMGADVTIAVHLSRYGTAPAIEAEAVETHGRLPWALQTIMQSIEIMQSGISTIQPEGTTVPVEVDFSGEVDPGIRHFSAGRRFIALGEAAMRAALPQLATMLPWLQPQVGDLAPAPAEILASRPIA